MLKTYIKKIVILVTLSWKILSVSILMLFDKLKGNKIVIIDISSAGFVQYICPVYKELLKRKVKIAYYLSLAYPMREEVSGFQLSKRRQFFTKIAPHLFFSDMFIEAEHCVRGPKNAIRVLNWHGQLTKFNNWSEEDLHSFDVFFLIGPLSRGVFESIKRDKPEHSNHIQLYNVGYPKIDKLINKEYSRNDVLANLNLDVKLPTILYAPAWDPGGSLRVWGTEIIEQLLKNLKVNIIVKLHPASLEPKKSPYFDFYTGGIDWVECFKKYENNHKFYHVTEYLVNPYLEAADCMITDFSGVALEFMLLDKPVIYIDCPEFYEKTLKEWGQDPKIVMEDDCLNSGRNTGIVVKDISKLTNIVEYALSHPEELSEKRKELSKKLLESDKDRRRMSVALDVVIENGEDKEEKIRKLEEELAEYKQKLDELYSALLVEDKIIGIEIPVEEDE